MFTMVDRKRWRFLLLVAAVALIGLSYLRPSGSAGQTQSTPAKPVEKTSPQRSEMAASGRRVFAGSCGMAYCHGTDGVGGGAPRLRNREYSAAKLSRVIRDGIPGTAMPAFVKSLSQVQISQLVAYLLSVNREVDAPAKTDRLDPHLAPPTGDTTTKPDVKPDVRGIVSTPAAAPTTSTVAGSAAVAMAGDWQAGEAIFFDPSNLANCRVCHTLHGRGGKVGSDLSRLSSEPPATILRRIVTPASSTDGRYARVTLRLKSGATISGILRDEDEKTYRIFDTTTLPPVSRSYLREEVTSIDRLAESGCPSGNGAKFTLQQLLDLVALIRTSDPAQPARVTAEEVLK